MSQGGKPETYGIEGEADTGVLLMASYNPSRPDLNGRKSVLGTDYSSEGTHSPNGRDLLDIVSDQGFEGGKEEAREMVSPPTADLLHPCSTSDVLKELEQDPDQEKYVVRFYSKPGKTDPQLLEYLEESDSFAMVNPLEARKATAYKDRSHDLLEGSGIPTIPSIDAEEAVDRGESYTINNIGELGEGYVLKAANSSKGRHQWHPESWEQLLSTYEDENIDQRRGDFLVQPFIPHERGHRWMTYGGDVRTGMVRRPGDDYRTNASTAEATGSEQGAIEAMQQDRIAPLQPDGHEEIQIAEDAAGELAVRFADPDLAMPNIITSVDLMITDRENLEGLPDNYQEAVNKYGEGDEAYLVTEFESIPGERIDHMYMWSGQEEGMPALQEALFLEELAGNEVPDAEDVAGDIQDRIWARVRANYRSPERILAEKIDRERRRGNTASRIFTGP